MMFENLTETDSSFVRGITFNENRNIIEVLLENKDGLRPYYYNKSRKTYENFINAESIGKYFSKYIKHGQETFTDEYQWVASVREDAEDILETILSTCTNIFEKITSYIDTDALTEAKRITDFLRKRTRVTTKLFKKENEGAITNFLSFTRNLIKQLANELGAENAIHWADEINELKNLSERLEGLKFRMEL